MRGWDVFRISRENLVVNSGLVFLRWVAWRRMRGWGLFALCCGRQREQYWGSWCGQLPVWTCGGPCRCSLVFLFSSLFWSTIHFEGMNEALCVGWGRRFYSCSFYVIYSVCVCLGNRNPELSQDLFVIVDNRPMLSCMGNTFIHYI